MIFAQCFGTKDPWISKGFLSEGDSVFPFVCPSFLILGHLIIIMRLKLQFEITCCPAPGSQ